MSKKLTPYRFPMTFWYLGSMVSIVLLLLAENACKSYVNKQSNKGTIQNFHYLVPHFFSVVHYTLVIVRNIVAVENFPVMFFEIVELVLYNILLQNANELISIWSSLFVMEAQGMTKLVSDNSFLKKKFEFEGPGSSLYATCERARATLLWFYFETKTTAESQWQSFHIQLQLEIQLQRGIK